MSTITIWENFWLKICKKFQFLLAIEQKFCWKKQGEVIAKFCRKPLSSAKMYWGGLFDVSENCGLEKHNLKQASRSFIRSFLSDSNKRFCLWDLLSVHASVLQRLHLRVQKCSRKKSRRNGVIPKKRIISRKRKKLSRVTILLHETLTKNHLVSPQRGRRKTPQKQNSNSW